MSTTITWTISELERYTANGIVYNVHYRVDATDGIYKAGAYGSIGLDTPAEDDEVVPYSDLTPELVTTWVKESLGTEQVEQVEAALANKVIEQGAPTTAKGTPW